MALSAFELMAILGHVTRAIAFTVSKRERGRNDVAHSTREKKGVNRVGTLAKKGEDEKWRDVNEFMLRYYLYYHLRSFLFILSVPHVATPVCKDANGGRVLFSVYYFHILIISHSLPTPSPPSLSLSVPPR